MKPTLKDREPSNLMSHKQIKQSGYPSGFFVSEKEAEKIRSTKADEKLSWIEDEDISLENRSECQSGLDRITKAYNSNP